MAKIIRRIIRRHDRKDGSHKRRPLFFFNTSWLYAVLAKFPSHRVFRPLVIRLGTFGMISGCLTLGIAYYSAGEIYEYQDTVDGAHLPNIDAIVCLAGGRGRIAAAGDLWYRYWERARKVDASISKVP